MMLTITTNSFENDVLRADKPVLWTSGRSGALTAADCCAEIGRA